MKSKKAKALEVNAKDAPTKDVAWDVEQAEVEPVKVEQDDGGAPIVLRTFRFAFSPEQLQHGPITESRLKKSVNFKNDSGGTQAEKLKMIEHHLWADGLELVDIPKVVLTEDKKGFYVFATAQALRGHIYSSLDKPLKLKDVLNTGKHTE